MLLRRFLCFLTIISFLPTLVILPTRVQAQPLLGLPEPGTMVNLSPAFEPVLMKGLKVYPDNPFRLDFVLDRGDEMSAEAKGVSALAKEDYLKQTSTKLIKYFLAAMTIPEKDLWVNLSPYEKDRLIAPNLGETEMGRDMLAQDYILKQLTASLIYPEKGLGKTFWDKVYAKAQHVYGSTEIPVNTFNKVWIVADKADVFERGNVAYVVGARLKVMLEEDYLALQKSEAHNPKSEARNSSLGNKIIRDVILPEIENEVNHGKNFAPLRQMFYSMILASWYKTALKDALLTQIYGNQSKVKVGVNQDDPKANEEIFNRYLQAYKKGVFNYIKEDAPVGGQSATPRKYFSGGTDFAMLNGAGAGTVLRHLNTLPPGTAVNSDRAVLAGVTVNPAWGSDGAPKTHRVPHILVLDDGSVLAKGLAVDLEVEHYRVTFKRSHEAIRTFLGNTDKRVDLIILRDTPEARDLYKNSLEQGKSIAFLFRTLEERNKIRADIERFGGSARPWQLTVVRETSRYLVDKRELRIAISEIRHRVYRFVQQAFVGKSSDAAMTDNNKAERAVNKLLSGEASKNIDPYIQYLYGINQPGVMATIDGYVNSPETFYKFARQGIVQFIRDTYRYVIFVGMGESAATVELFKKVFKAEGVKQEGAIKGIFALKSTATDEIKAVLNQIQASDGVRTLADVLRDAVIVSMSASASSDDISNLFVSNGFRAEAHILSMADMDGEDVAAVRVDSMNFLLPLSLMAPHLVPGILSKVQAWNQASAGQGNSALELGTTIHYFATSKKHGAKKKRVTLILPEKFISFGPWAKQLVKNILGEKIEILYGEALTKESLKRKIENDRFLLYITVNGDRKDYPSTIEHFITKDYPLRIIYVEGVTSLIALLLSFQRAIAMASYWWKQDEKAVGQTGSLIDRAVLAGVTVNPAWGSDGAPNSNARISAPRANAKPKAGGSAVTRMNTDPAQMTQYGERRVRPLPIMIIDVKGTAHGIKDALTAKGYKVIVADSHDNAKRLLKDNRVSLIILDDTEAGMELYGRTKIRAVFLTSRRDWQNRARELMNIVPNRMLSVIVQEKERPDENRIGLIVQKVEKWVPLGRLSSDQAMTAKRAMVPRYPDDHEAKIHGIFAGHFAKDNEKIMVGQYRAGWNGFMDQLRGILDGQDGQVGRVRLNKLGQQARAIRKSKKYVILTGLGDSTPMVQAIKEVFWKGPHPGEKLKDIYSLASFDPNEIVAVMEKIRVREGDLDQGDVHIHYKGTDPAFLFPLALFQMEAVAQYFPKAQEMKMPPDIKDDPLALFAASLYYWIQQSKKDKLTLLLPPELESLGPWYDQLFHRILGDKGRQVFISYGEDLRPGDLKPVADNDRLFFALQVRKGEDSPIVTFLKENKYPVESGVFLNGMEHLVGFMLDQERLLAMLDILWKGSNQGDKSDSTKHDRPSAEKTAASKVLPAYFGSLKLSYLSLIQANIFTKEKLVAKVKELEGTMEHAPVVYAAIILLLREKKFQVAQLLVPDNMPADVRKILKQTQAELFTRHGVPSKLVEDARNTMGPKTIITGIFPDAGTELITPLVPGVLITRRRGYGPENFSKDIATFFYRVNAVVENAAMAVPTGGIDLNRANMLMNRHKEGAGVEMTFDPAMIQRIRRDGFDGLEFRIDTIIPIANLPLLLGLREGDKEKGGAVGYSIPDIHCRTLA